MVMLEQLFSIGCHLSRAEQSVGQFFYTFVLHQFLPLKKSARISTLQYHAPLWTVNLRCTF